MKEENELTYKECSTSQMRREYIDIHNAPSEELLSLGSFLKSKGEPILPFNNKAMSLSWNGSAIRWEHTNYSTLGAMSILKFLAKYNNRVTESAQAECERQIREDEEAFTVAENKNTSDGGSNSFYIFPLFVCDIDSLARYWKLSVPEGNILKSLCANLGSRHGGTDKKREVRKSLHYAVERMRWEGFTDEEILAQVQKQIEDARNGNN